MIWDNQVAKLKPQTEELRQDWTIAAFVAVLLGVGLAMLFASQLRVSDAYTKTVLSLSGDSVQGHAIFQMNCAGCHNLQGKGQVGPSLHNVSGRKSRVQIIHQVTSGETPPMPLFKPSTQEMADLLSYLEKL